jgi:hypothetical protein
MNTRTKSLRQIFRLILLVLGMEMLYKAATGSF